jgi:hypothetical protein
MQQLCDACHRQLKLKQFAPAHAGLAEMRFDGFGAGFWRWRETSYRCSACGGAIKHTSSKTHRGPSWTEGSYDLRPGKSSDVRH